MGLDIAHGEQTEATALAVAWSEGQNVNSLAQSVRFGPCLRDSTQDRDATAGSAVIVSVTWTIFMNQVWRHEEWSLLGCYAVWLL
jgi:hypothetical protein